MKVKGEDIDWTHVFTSGDELAVPGLGIAVKNVAKAGMFIKVKIEPDDDMLTLKVRLTQMRLYMGNLGMGDWGGWKRTQVDRSNHSKTLVRFPIFLVFQPQVHSRAHEYSESCCESKLLVDESLHWCVRCTGLESRSSLISF